MYLYTIIVGFMGGSFVKQIKAPNEVLAIRLWAKAFYEENYLPRISKFIANKIYKDSVENNRKPTLLDGMEGVWYEFTVFKNEHVSIHIVKTAWPMKTVESE